MGQAGLVNSFLAAIQASLSVLLVIFYGGVSARLKLLDASSAKSISKICVKIFLPALLLTKIGSELHAGSAHRYALILLWALVCHLVSFLIGIAAHLLLGMPDWITAALMFNNTTSYPLLLIQSLDATGILSNLVSDEPSRAAIERAKSYFLVFATVSSCLTFAVGPRLIDSEHGPDPHPDKKEGEPDEYDEETEDLEAGRFDDDHAVSPNDESRPLFESNLRNRRPSHVPVSFVGSKRPESSSKPPPKHVVDRRPSVIGKKRWLHLSDRARWWLLFFWDFVNAPLIGAVLGAFIGLIPPLHRAFFSDTDEGGIFTAWLTSSLDNVGGLFVPLPVVVAGVSLYNAMTNAKGAGDTEAQSGTPTSWLTTAFVLVVRFVIWPVISIGVIYLLATKTTFLEQDPMLWFAMMLMPTGPPAMKLITLVEVSDANEEDEHKIAKLLTISYVISPILAFTVVGSLQASQAALRN